MGGGPEHNNTSSAEPIRRVGRTKALDAGRTLGIRVALEYSNVIARRAEGIS